MEDTSVHAELMEVGTPVVAGLPMPEFGGIEVELSSGACGCEYLRSLPSTFTTTVASSGGRLR